MKNTSAIILAGGEGKRMKSNRPKVLSEVIFQPMLKWVIDAVRMAGIKDICVVTGSKREFVEEYLKTLPFEVETVFQPERLGTGHAVMMAIPFLEKHRGSDVLILNGDAPFIGVDTIRNAYVIQNQTGETDPEVFDWEAPRKPSEKRGCTVISAEVENPSGYGRIVYETDAEEFFHLSTLKAIVEEKEATDEIRKIKEVNSGAYWFETDILLDALGKLTKSEKTGEYYLTDTIEIIKDSGNAVMAYKAKNSDSVLGANDCIQLAQLNEIARMRIIRKHQKNGVNIPCTDGVIIGRDVTIAANTTILPATVIRGKTNIASFCEIGPAVSIDSCEIGQGHKISNKNIKDQIME